MNFISRLLGRASAETPAAVTPVETAADRAAWLHSTLHTALATAGARHTGQGAQRSFQAAETPAWTDSWSTHIGELNEVLARQLPILRSRSRGLGRDNEWANAYLTQLDDNVLGVTGIRLQMQLKLPNGEPDLATNRRIEDGWARFCQRGACEVSGKLNWREVESLALSTLARDGEMVNRHRAGSGPCVYRVQMIYPALLDVSVHREYGGHRVRMGVELDDDGVPLFYWLRASRAGDAPSDYTTVGRHLRVPARDMAHHFITTEVDQIRGIPWLTVGARRLWLLQDFEEAAAVASSNAAKRQGFFTSPTGEAPPGMADVILSKVKDAAAAAGRELSSDEMRQIAAAAEKFSTTMPGQYDTLPNGYEFTAYTSDWPNVQADSYIKQHVRGWTAARGASYVSVGNDLEAVNYSSAQVGIGGEREHYKWVQKTLSGWLHEPTFAQALPGIILRDPGLRMSRLQDYLDASTWQPRRWKPLDPVKAATADEMRLRAKTTTRRKILLEEGEDPDEILAEAEREEKRFGPLVPNTGTPAKTDNTDNEGEGAGKKKPADDAD